MSKFILQQKEALKPVFLTDNEDVKLKVVSFINEWENDLDFFVTNTSGSTGTPKKISIQKEHAIQSALSTCEALKLTSKHTAILCLNPTTIGGKMMIVRSMVLDMKLLVGELNSNPLVTCDEKIDFIALVPLQLKKMVEECPDKLRKISTIIVGGGSISAPLENSLKEAKITVYQTFGMTETISHIALKKVGFENSEYYTVLPSVEISAEENLLVIHAPKIGVFNLKTNDLVEIISPTQFKWLGRADFVINSGGIKIIPEVLEAQLSHLINVPFFVVGMDDETLGQRVVVIVEGFADPQLEQKSYYHSLEKFHIPKEIYFLSNFNYTESGKINKIETLKLTNVEGFRKIL